MASNRIKGITIEIGGDTTKLVSALSSVDKAIASTKTNLKDIDNALKLDPTNINLLKDKQVELNEEVKKSEEKLKLEKQALEQMKNTEGFDANSKAARDLQTQIDLDESALNQLKKEVKDFGSVASQQFQAVGDKVKEIGEKIKGVGDSIKNVGTDLTTKVTGPIVAAVGTAVKTTADFDAQMSKVQAISGATSDEFAQLRDKAREMGANTKYSATEAGEAFEYMGMAGWKTEQMLEGIPAILNLAAASGEELGTTSDIVTDALTAFGLKAEDAGRFSDILASAATNANTNVSMMGESFKYVAPVAGSLGYSAEDVAIALGLMANSGIKADMAGTSLRNMFQRLAKPTKESYNAMVQLGLSIADSEGNAYSFREIMDQIRTSFADVNVDLDEYNRSLDDLDSMLQEGEISQEKYDEMLNQLNVDLLGTAGSEKARYAAMLGGTRAMSGLLAIANATEEDYNKLTAAIDGSSDAFAKLADGSVVPLNEALESGAEILETYNGQAEAMAATMQDNLTGDITVLKSQLQELAISFGDLLMPLLREVVGKIQDVVDWLNSLDDSQKEQILKIAAIVAAVGPVLVVLGTVISSIETIVSGVGTLISIIGTLLPILAGPVGIILAIVAAVAALGVIIYKNWDTIKEWAQGVATVGKEKWEEAKTAVSEKLTEMKEAASQKFEEIKEKVANSQIGQTIGTVWQAAKDTMQEKLDNIRKAYDEHGGGLEGAVAGAIEAIKGYYSAGFTFIDNLTGGKLSEMLNTVKSKMESIKSDISNKWSNIKSDVQYKVNEMRNNVSNTFDNIRYGITNSVGGIRDAIINGFSNAVDYIMNLPSQAWSWGADIIDGIISGIRDKIGGIVDAISDVAEIISSYIHFSEPDVGPLRDFHTFMPDMIKEMVYGINKGIPSLENAMRGMADNLVPQGMLGNTTNGGNVTTTNTVNISVNAANMNAYQLASELTDLIQSNINAQVYRQGAAWS